MSEIKVGEYVRTKKGLIGKLIEIDLNNNAYYLDCGQCVSPINIVNHRKKRIDLIEEGDYVNGYIVLDVAEDLGTGELQLEMPSSYPKNGSCTLYNDEIKSIVTHEQFKNIEYKVGE